MEEMELRLGDLFALVLRKWRSILNIGIVVAVLLGMGMAAYRIVSMNDPEMLEKWQTEYESIYSAYWATVHNVDYQVKQHEYTIQTAEKELENLDWVEEKYRLDIEKIQGDIESYGLQIQALEKSIEEYRMDKAEAEYLLKWQQEQNANSLYMQIDPYKVQTAEAYIWVDTDYQIIPGSTYQNPNQTGEVLERYRLAVNSAAFYEQMITELQLKTEVRYLTEVISVETYGENSLRVKVVGTDPLQLENMVGYICDTILQKHEEVSSAVTRHTVEVYGRRGYSVVDMSVYSAQQAKLQTARDRETVIRQKDEAILNAQARIRQINADIRQYEQDIKDNEVAIAQLPQVETELKNEIDVCRDNISQLRQERVELLEEPEPKYAGFTWVSVLTGFVKFAIIGGVAGVFAATVWLMLSKLLGGKVLSAQSLTDYFGVTAFGVWPEAKQKKLPFAFVDRWMDRLTRAQKGDKKLVCANVAASTQGYSNVLLCGGADVEQIRAVAAEIGKNCSGVQMVAAGSVVSDAGAVSGLAACDAVILAETLYQSDMNAVQQLMERAKTMNKPVLGVVIM